MTSRPLRLVHRPEPKPDPRGFRREGHHIHRTASGAWQGPSFHVWDKEEPEAERWARTLAQMPSAGDEAR